MRPTAATAPAKPRLIHSFKPGRHTTMAGEVIEFTAADLAATAAAYSPTLSRAPIVKGHPKTDSPAQGWIGGIEARADGLFAKPEQVDPAFAEEVRAGRWVAVSMKFYRPTDPNNPKPGVWYPKHLGFLGAHPPSVKGLEPPAFAQQSVDDDGCVCFSEAVAFGSWEAMTAATLWRGLRDWFIGRFGTEEADRVLPSYAVGQLEAAAQAEQNEPMVRPAFAESPPPPAAPPAPAAAQATPSPPKESTVTDQEAQALRDENARLKREADENKQRAAEQAAQALQADNVAFAEGLARDMRIPTAAVPLLAAVGAQLQRSAEVEFGEGNDKQPLHQAWRTWAQALPPMATPGEQATRERAATGTAGAAGHGDDDAEFGEADPERLALHKRIQDHAKANGVSYAQAAQAVMRTK